MKSIYEIKEILNTPKNIVITTHQNPDADALGSSLALQMYLQLKGHTVQVISSTEFPNFLGWMNGSANISIFEKNEKQTLAILFDAEILFCLDFNIHTRTKNLSEHLLAYNGVKVLIDHHLQPDEAFFNYGISNINKSSTCEMVYDFIVNNNDIHLLNKAMASCLYAGTMTDTGSFRYTGTTAQTHNMVAQLLETGIVPNQIHQQIFDTYPEKRLRLLGHILSNNLTINNAFGTALMHLSLQEMANFDVQNGDTEGIVNYPLCLKNVNFATFITEKAPNDIRMSFRSKDNIDVNAFARTYFNGGGHINAAGGKGLDTLEATIEKYNKDVELFFKK